VISALGQCPCAHRRFCAPTAGEAQHPGASYRTLFSPDLASGFHLLPKVKDHLTVITLTQDTFKSIWEQVIMTLTSEEFAAAYRGRKLI
jgi:hypothetical protein